MTRCAVCGRQGRWDDHHPTGTDEDGSYLDPEMTLPACHDHHELVGDDWKTLDIEALSGPLTEVDIAVLRLRRTATTLARIAAGKSPQLALDLVLEQLPTWADDLDRLARRLDIECPQWRQVPGSGGDASER